MVDNSSQQGTDTIATDDVATLNGSASSGIKVQRIKVAFGDDGTARDVSASFPLPTVSAVQTSASTLTNTAPVATVGTSATLVLAAGTYRVVAFENFSAVNLYLGASGVTTSSYFKRLQPGESVAFTGADCPTNAVYAVSTIAAQTLAVGVAT